MRTYDSEIPEYVDCTLMSNLMGISRTRLYQLIKEGIILQPIYLIANRRPYYTKEMALRNLQVKENNVGINGQVIMFYSSRRINPSISKPKPKAKRKERVNDIVPTSNTKHGELIEALEALGLDDITAEKIDSAIHKCFPEGIQDVSDDEILRSVFRYLKCQNSSHKPRT